MYCSAFLQEVLIGDSKLATIILVYSNSYCNTCFEVVMVFTPLCRGNQMGGLYHLQGFLAKYCITNWIFNVRHGITIVNNKISRYRYFQNIAIYR